MNNAELISMVRSIAKHGADWRINEVLNRAADALEAAEKRIAELSLDCEMYQQKCMELDAKMQTVTNCHTLKEGER